MSVALGVLKDHKAQTCVILSVGGHIQVDIVLHPEIIEQ